MKPQFKKPAPFQPLTSFFPAIAFFFVSLLLASCTQTSSWDYQQMASHAPNYKTEQLSLKPENLFSGLGLQLIKTDDKVTGYFNIYSRRLNTNEGTLWIDKKPIYFQGHLLEGQQRLQLPDAITHLVLEALNEDKEVMASIDSFSCSLPKPNKLL